MIRLRPCLIILALLWPAAAQAHKPSDSYLTLTPAGAEIDGQWDIALRDLDDAIGVDGDGDGAITWGELRARHDAIAAYALSRLTIQGGGGDCPARAGALLVDDHSDGAYAVLRFTAACPRAIEALRIGYDLLFDIDMQHRGLLRISASALERVARGHRLYRGALDHPRRRQAEPPRLADAPC